MHNHGLHAGLFGKSTALALKMRLQPARVHELQAATVAKLTKDDLMLQPARGLWVRLPAFKGSARRFDFARGL